MKNFAGDTRWIMSTAEASRLIRISPNKLREMAEKGEIPAFRLGKNWRYRRDDLFDWVEEQVTGSQKGGSDAEV
jgi:excisionase family DNA binding protein